MTRNVTREFRLPDLGEGLEDAVLVEWHVQVGDTVTLNQLLCTVETAKATVSIPSPLEGAVVQIIGEPGATVAVGDVLVRVEQATVSEEARPARQPTLVGYGPDVGPTRRRQRTPSLLSESAPAHPPARILAKPPVRRMARDLGVDLAALAPGSGPDGVITRADVERAAEAVASDVDPATSAPPRRERVRPGSVIPVQGVRARVADRMTASRSTIPEASCRVVVDCARLLEVRNAVRRQAMTARS
jgi:2-oxoisovalerate dehydrogenase E2 component (dihydrolipoyl transacylase)